MTCYSHFSAVKEVESMLLFKTLMANLMTSSRLILSLYSCLRIDCAAWLFAPIAVACTWHRSRVTTAVCTKSRFTHNQGSHIAEACTWHRSRVTHSCVHQIQVYSQLRFTHS